MNNHKTLKVIVFLETTFCQSVLANVNAVARCVKAPQLLAHQGGVRSALTGAAGHQKSYRCLRSGSAGQALRPEDSANTNKAGGDRRKSRHPPSGPRFCSS